MRNFRSLLVALTIFLVQITLVHAQDTTVKKFSLLPSSTTINASTNFHWFMFEGLNGNWIDQMYITGRMKYSDHIDLVIVNKTKFMGSRTFNKFSDIYLNYSNSFKPSEKFPIFKYGSYLDIRAGMFEWYPTYTNI